MVTSERVRRGTIFYSETGLPRIRGSHYIFKTPWKGDPRINLQKVDKMAKFYQVKDVKKAIEKMEAKKNEE
jgi:hypothetical protein